MQMPQRFLRGVQQRQASRASAGSSSSAGSCTSSPSANPTGGRGSGGGPLALQQYLQSMQTPVVPPLPSSASQEDVTGLAQGATNASDTPGAEREAASQAPG